MSQQPSSNTLLPQYVWRDCIIPLLSPLALIVLANTSASFSRIIRPTYKKKETMQHLFLEGNLQLMRWFHDALKFPIFELRGKGLREYLNYAVIGGHMRVFEHLNAMEFARCIPFDGKLCAAAIASDRLDMFRYLRYRQLDNVISIGGLPPKFKHFAALEELVVSERSFVEDLELMFTLFRNPIREKRLLSEKDIQCLFRNAETVYPMHQEFLRQCDGLLWPKGRVNQLAEAFLKLFASLKTYTRFCVDITAAFDTNEILLQNASASVAFSRFHQEVQQTRGVRLRDFINKTLARVCKYQILIQQIVQCLSRDDVEYEMLVQARERHMECLALWNRVKAEEDARAVMNSK